MSGPDRSRVGRHECSTAASAGGNRVGRPAIQDPSGAASPVDPSLAFESQLTPPPAVTSSSRPSVNPGVDLESPSWDSESTSGVVRVRVEKEFDDRRLAEFPFVGGIERVSERGPRNVYLVEYEEQDSPRVSVDARDSPRSSLGTPVSSADNSPGKIRGKTDYRCGSFRVRMDDLDPSIGEREIPPALSENLQIAFRLDDRPEVLGELLEFIVRSLLEDSGLQFADLCSTEATRHEAHIGDDVQHFHCVLDALIVPFVVDEHGPIEIISRSPLDDSRVEILASQEAVETTPDDAVMSLGIETDVEQPATDAFSPELWYDRFCPYVNAFRSRERYEQWAGEVTEAETMQLPIEEGYVLAKTLAQ